MKRKRHPPAGKSKAPQSTQTPDNAGFDVFDEPDSEPLPGNTKPAKPKKKKGVDTPLRIIGGQLKGSKLEYSGDPRTRPMKERVREALFNLVGPSIKGMQAIDLFAGTGALALESISRGAASAVAIERHFPTADLIKQNGRSLSVANQLQVLAGDTFIWVKRLLGGQTAAIAMPELSTGPWAVYCCPPYVLYEERQAEMLELIAAFYQVAPAGSCILVEADERFDFGLLIESESWDVRRYHPAILGILRKP